jgi:hypothetical protein
MAVDSYLRSIVRESLGADSMFGRAVRLLKSNGFAVILLAINQSFHQLIS